VTLGRLLGFRFGFARECHGPGGSFTANTGQQNARVYLVPAGHHHQDERAPKRVTCGWDIGLAAQFVAGQVVTPEFVQALWFEQPGLVVA
jgi:hypothetical protein